MSQKPNLKKTENSFSSSLGFLFSAIAAAVGLSNIWRFPAEAANHGGGIYVLVYLICVVTIGYPIILSELAFGRSKQQGVYESYKNTGAWKWSGAFAAFTCFLIFCFYNIVSGWVVGYIWQFIKGFFMNPEGSIYHEGDTKKFFDALQGDFWGNLLCTAIMALSAILILQAGVSGGIERCAKVLMPIFIVMMLGLIAYSFTLENADKGILHYIKPVPSKFTLAGLANALSQSLISLGIGMASLMTYGAYVDKKDNLYKSSLIIGLGDTAVAFCAGLFLFGFLGHYNPDIATEKIEAKNGALAFITLPWVLITKFPSGVACVLGASFFLLIFFAAITSSITLLEVPARYVESRFKIERNKTLWLVASLSYLVSILCIGSDFWHITFKTFDFHDRYQKVVVGIAAPLSTFLFSLFIAQKWGVKNLFRECGSQQGPNKYFVQYIKISLNIISPLVTCFGFLYSLGQIFGIWKYLFC